VTVPQGVTRGKTVDVIVEVTPASGSKKASPAIQMNIARLDAGVSAAGTAAAVFAG